MDKRLVAATPWTHETAIEGLFQSATAGELTLAGRRVRVICEQLLRAGTTAPERPIRLIALDGAAALPTDWIIEIRTAEGTLPAVREDDAEVGTRMFVPAADTVVAMTVSVRAADGTDSHLEVLCPPVRDWEIHLIHHSHLDIGYTDYQPTVLAQHRSFLDTVVELVRAEPDDSDPTAFRWVVEATSVFTDWARNRPAELVAEFLEYVRRGRIEVTAIPYNMHSDTCSTEELHELMRPAREFEAEHGIALNVAMQTDVPGAVAGLPDALADAGVEYLTVAHNWAGRSMPQEHGGTQVPRLFQWRSLAGKKITVWMTDSPHGMAYMEGPLLGLHHSEELTEQRLPVYLTALAGRPYPYPPGVFGWHGDRPAVDREPFAGSIIQLRTSGTVGDNAPARTAAAQIAREWNEKWLSPRLVTATNQSFFDRVLADEPEVPEFTGDWGDWWVEGVGSAARPQKMVREAQRLVRRAETAASLTGTHEAARVADSAREVYESISLFNEHTWGAANPWNYADAGFDSGDLEWEWKVAQVHRAVQSAVELNERVVAHAGFAHAGAADALSSYRVLNSASVARTIHASLLLKDNVAVQHPQVVARDRRTGEPLAARVRPQVNPAHREAGRWIDVVVADVPAFGAVTVDVYAAEESTPATTPATGDTAATHPVIENEYLRATVDLARAGISSLVDIRTGRELLNTDSLFVGNEYIYDLYTTAPGFNHQSNKTSSSPELELLGSRVRARGAYLVSVEHDATESRLTYAIDADGVETARTTLRLRAGEPVLHVENHYNKPSTMAKESAYLAFPFAPEYGAQIRYEVTGGITGDDLPIVPGSPDHMRCIRHFVSAAADDHHVAWVTADAPLVQRGAIALPYAPFPDSTSPREPGTVFSWLHNNIWDTNFPVQQRFNTTFRFGIGVPANPGDDSSATALRTVAAVTEEHVVIPATGRTQTATPDAALPFATSTPGVEVMGFTHDGDDVLVRVQSLTAEPLTLTAQVPAGATVRLCDLSGAVVRDLDVANGSVSFDLAPLENVAVRVTLG